MIKKRTEVNFMLYCAKCQILVENGAECPSCGSKKLREVRQNDPVLLLTSDEVQSGSVKAAFDDSGIPHEERMCGPGAPPSLLYGRSPNSLYHIFVPFGAVEQCREILQEIGVPGENEEAGQGLSLPENDENEDGFPLHRVRRILIRIWSAVCLLVLIWAVVELSDTLIAFLKSAFR